jgi:hypothetical protein
MGCPHVHEDNYSSPSKVMHEMLLREKYNKYGDGAKRRVFIDPSSVGTGFLLGQVALGLVFLSELRFYPVSIITLMLHNYVPP